MHLADAFIQSDLVHLGYKYFVNHQQTGQSTAVSLRKNVHTLSPSPMFQRPAAGRNSPSYLICLQFVNEDWLWAREILPGCIKKKKKVVEEEIPCIDR